MVVTQSLAKGVVREVIRRQCETRGELIARIKKVRIRPPSTKRRFAEWFRERVSIHEKEALLIAHGMVGRRTGAFAAYSLNFVESESDWRGRIAILYIEFSPQRIERIVSETLPVIISGHALERVFQRTESIDWKNVRDCIAGATLFANAVASAWLASGCKQCAVLAEKGMLVGHVEDDAIHLRTFLPETQLGARWEALYRDLKDFSEEHEEMINAAALGSNEDASLAFSHFLESGKHRWLFQSYVAGKDCEEVAWRAREQALAREDMALAS